MQDNHTVYEQRGLFARGEQRNRPAAGQRGLQGRGPHGELGVCRAPGAALAHEHCDLVATSEPRPSAASILAILEDRVYAGPRAASALVFLRAMR